MTTIPQVASALQSVLGAEADQAGLASGLVQRPTSATLTGSLLSQTLVFGFLADPLASRETLAQTAAVLGAAVSPQAIDQRLTQPAAHCLEAVLACATRQVIAAQPAAIPLLQRFQGVLVQDTSTITFPAELAHIWRGCGNNHTPVDQRAGLKLGVRLDLSTGRLVGPTLDHGSTADLRSAIAEQPIPTGALHIADVGFFSLDALTSISATGGLFLSRLAWQTAVFVDGERLELLELLQGLPEPTAELTVELGVDHRLPARLLVQRVPQEVADQRRRRLRQETKDKGRTPSARRLALCDWTWLVTNVPPQQLTLREALVLLVCRWQIELLFKLWKSHNRIDEWRSGKPWAILCELYAKLLGCVVQHWLLLVGCWQAPERSLMKAACTIRQQALPLLLGLKTGLEAAITLVVMCLQHGCRINRSRKTPRTWQQLLAAHVAEIG